MHRPSPRRVLFASLVSLGLMTGLAVLAAPALAQVNQRAYAPENLSRLSVSDQSRVISLEYRDQSGGRSIPADQLRFYLDQVRESRWTFSQVRADIAESLGNTAGGWRPPGTGPANAIRCESTDGRPRTCTTQWQGQSRLLRQLSSTACVQGSSWFTSRGQVTVSNGCRGEFGPGRGAQAAENLSRLSVSEQTRVISLEYREQSGGRSIPADQLRFYLDQVAQSRWTFSQIKDDIAESLGNTGGGWRQPNAGPANAIRCESTDGRPRTCTTQWQGQSRLLKQLSSNACILGRSWFTSRGQVTVSNGCRGEFGPGRGGQGAGLSETVQCESTDGRLRTCGSNLSGRIELQRQISNTRCVEGTNFGLRNGSVWVDRGCRGVFLVQGGRGNNRPGDGGNYSVTCASENSRYTTCAWDSRRGQPYLIERLSKQACTNGYSWGYSARSGLWVNHGCRARFGTR